MESFGDRLKKLIKTSEFKTNKRFCEEVKISEQGLSRIIQGKNNPSFDLIVACLERFSDIDVHWLLTGKSHESHLRFENEQLKREVDHYKRKLGTIAKPYSNRINSQQTERTIGVTN